MSSGGIQEGLLLCNAMHITASVFINDDEAGLHHDLEVWLEKLAPEKPHAQCQHNGFEDNADAHLKRSVMGREVVVAETEGEMMKEPINIMMQLNHKENSTFDIAQILPAAGESPDGACQMYINGSCNVALSYNRDDTRKCLQGIREAFAVLAELGYPVEPPKLKWVFVIPDFILTTLLQRVLRSKIADIGMARHLRNAQEEMDQLNKEFQVLIKKAGIETPVINELDRRAKAVLSSSSAENPAGRNEFVTSAG